MKKLLFSSMCLALASLSALADDVTINVKSTTGTISGGNTWVSTPTSNGGPSVLLTVVGGGVFDSTGSDAADQNVGENLYLGSSAGTRTVVIAPSAGYYVSAFSTNVRGIKGDAVSFTKGSTTVTSGSTATAFSATYDVTSLATFTIATTVQGHNKKAICEDFTITLSPITSETITVNTTNGALDLPGNWSHYWLSNIEGKPVVKVSNVSANIGTISAEGVYDFRAGSAYRADYTISTETDGYYVSAFTFKAVGNGPKINIGNGEVAISNDGVTFTKSVPYGTPATFIVNTSNTLNKLLDFNVTVTPINPGNDAFLAFRHIAEAKSQLELWHPILGDELYTQKRDSLNAMNLPASQAEVNTLIGNVDHLVNHWMAEAEGRLIYAQNVRRNGSKYLTAVTGNHINTVASPVAKSNWIIVREGTNSTGFKLLNPETHQYIQQQVNDNTAISLGTAANAAIFELKANTSGNAGTALVLKNTADYGINVNTGDGNAVTYAYNDPGSSWTITLAGVPASQITAGKYYRIRSQRAMWGYQSKGSLIGVNTAVENNQARGDVDNDGQKTSGLGTIWKVEQVEGKTDKYYLRNVATEYDENGGNYFGTGGAASNVTNNKGEFTFVTTASSWAHKHPNAVILKNQNNAYIDKVSADNGNFGTWTQVDNKWPNNGGIYIFEEATDYETLKNAYIAAENATIANYTVDGTNAKIDMYAQFPTLWDTKAARAAVASMPVLTAATTVSEANALHFNKSEAITAHNAIINTIKQTADGKTVRFANVDRGDAHYITHGAAHNASGAALSENDTDSGNNVLLCTVGEDNELKTLWTLKVNEEGNYKLVNHLSGEAVKHHGGGETAQDMTSEDEGSYFTIEPNTSAKAGLDYAIQIKFGNNSCWHESANEGKRVVLWSNAASSAPSGWYVNVMEETESESNEAVTAELVYDADSQTHSIVFYHSNDDFDIHPQAGDCVNPLKIKITAKTPAAKPGMRREEAADSKTEFDVNDLNAKNVDGEVVLPIGRKLPAGEYTITAPAGLFTVGNSVAGSISSSYSVDNNGTTTGVGEIVIDIFNAEGAIYDLQGRRLAAPVKGINIIGGRKVLVK